jgi:hypothetical protein
LQIYDDVLKPLDHFRYMVPRQRSSLPLVLVVGNHSSGTRARIASEHR